MRSRSPAAVALYLAAGVCWGVLALLFARVAYGREIIWGLVACPFIGVGVGLSMQPRFEAASRFRSGVAFLSLLISVAAFGLIGGILSVSLSGEPRGVERIWEYLATALYGTYFTGFFILFWPLAYFTHFLLSLAGERGAMP